MVRGVIKLSSPATKEFWQVPVLFEDEHLFALDKPSRLLTSPDRYEPDRPNLMKLLHRDMARGAAWAKERGLTYLANAHRLDFETTGVLLLAKDKPTLVYLANLFGSEKPSKTYIALVQGSSAQHSFSVSKKLGPHPTRLGQVRVDEKHGKKASTQFEVTDRFRKHMLLRCQPLTGRTHQIRVHLQSVRLPIVGDPLYGGRSLFLSSLKPGYRQKADQPEKALIGRLALHAAELALPHPTTGQMLTITAAWPNDLTVAVKYLRRFASTETSLMVGQQSDQTDPDPQRDQQQAGP